MSALRGTYHAIRPKYAQRYLAEFEYRFNRRFDLPDINPQTGLRGAEDAAEMHGTCYSSYASA